MTADYVVVGSGLTGAVIARQLFDAGREVLVLEQREHVGGNVHDQLHPSGIRFHTYGPHYFRTSSPRIWRYVRRFSPFYAYAAELRSFVEGAYENWPVTIEYVRRRIGEDWQPAFSGVPLDYEQASLAKMPLQVYELFVRGYTEKQWGRPARELSVGLASRFDLGSESDTRLKKHRYQGLPELGYTQMMSNMLEGIPLRLDTPYRPDEHRARRCLIYTGPIDEFFDYDLGRLHYRGQRREHHYLPDASWHQPVVQVNYPGHDDGPRIRTIEWKHLLPVVAQPPRGTLLTTETPCSPEKSSGYEYPFPDEANQRLYQRYRRKADSLTNVLICGRLGEYRYYDMDQAIARALVLGRRLLS